MEQKKQDDKKDKYDLDEDTSSFYPEIEEESNEEEEESSQKKEESNKNQNSPLMDKLISIQKKMDINQNRTKYPLYNYKENNNTDNNINKNIYKNNSNNNMNYYNNSRNNKNTLNLNESEQDEDDNNNNSSEPSYKNQQNKIKAKQQNNQYYPQNQEQSSITKKEKGCELFIGNLNITTEKEDLNNLFSKYGEITDIRIHKNEENKKCYAFVRFSTKESANLALKLDSTRLNSRNIKVTKSNENATIFIGNIRKSWTKEELETKIRRIFHNINKIEFFTDPGNPTKNRGFCFGIFNTRNEAIKALNYVNKKGGINIDGISITCDWADVVDEDDNSKSNQIFISNIKKEVSEYDLKKYFEKFEKVLSVIMSKNHLNSKRKDLAFITFESHESAVSAIQKFEEEKKNEKMEKNLKKIFYLAENENVNMIQVSLAFSQEAMQNKKKIKDNRKKIPSQISKGNSTNNINDNNINNNHRSNNNTNNNNNNNKTSGKTFMGNISMNAQNEYKNYSSGHRSKNYQRHEHGRSHNYIGANKNVHDLFSSLNNNNNKNIYGNQMNNYSGNKNNSNIDNNLYNQLNQLYSNSIEKTTNAFMNTNNNNNINNNLNQNPLSALTNLINLCQQNPNLLQQMTNMYNSNIGTNNEFVEINNEKKFLNRKRNSNNNYLENNLNNNNMNNNNEIQNNNYLNISQTQNQNQNIISQFPYIQNIPPVSPINNPNVSNIQNLQNITNFN